VGIVCYNTGGGSSGGGGSLEDVLGVVMTGTAMGVMVVTAVAALTLTDYGAMISR